jgi:TPR repeat protein
MTGMQNRLEAFKEEIGNRINGANRNAQSQEQSLSSLEVPNFSTVHIQYVLAAAEAGNAIAQDELGNRYWTGTDVAQNEDAAILWWGRSAGQGNPEAIWKLDRYMEVLAKLEEVDPKSAQTIMLFVYQAMAESGNPRAQFGVGSTALKLEGAEAFSYAAKWFAKAAAQGLAEAQCCLGHMYGQGAGVEKDYGKAVELFQQAAEQGLAQAQFYLGGCYQCGNGVEKNQALALEWMEKAADRGHVEARFCVGANYFYGNGAQKDEAKGLQMIKAAYEMGSKNAASFLTVLAVSVLMEQTQGGSKE